MSAAYRHEVCGAVVRGTATQRHQCPKSPGYGRGWGWTVLNERPSTRCPAGTRVTWAPGWVGTVWSEAAPIGENRARGWAGSAARWVIPDGQRVAVRLALAALAPCEAQAVA